MISYSAPKSQLWGHRVGRHSAADLVKLSLTFLSDQCDYSETKSELDILWKHHLQSDISKAVDDLSAEIGLPESPVDTPDFAGDPIRVARWSISSEQLPTIALWFDRLKEPIKKRQPNAFCVTNWMIKWRKHAISNESDSGGMFSIHLGNPQQVTTMFNFDDISQYYSIKSYLADIDLVSLSDKHIRPKTAIPAGSG